MSLLQIEKADGVATVRFVNPPKGLMNDRMVGELGQAAAEFQADAGLRVVVFTGGLNGVFIRHYDLADLIDDGGNAPRPDFEPPPGELLPERPIDKVFKAVENLPQATIAAINGFCMGGGYEFTLCCDIRLAVAGDYLIGLPEALSGIYPGAGGTQRLPRVVGVSRALELILRGRVVPPDVAARYGMVHEIVQSDVLAHAHEMAHEMASRAGGAANLRYIKEIVRQSLDRPLDEALARERTKLAELVRSTDMPEVLRKLMEMDADILSVKL